MMDQFIKAYVSLKDLFSGFYEPYYKDEFFIKTVLGSPITKDDIEIGFVSDVDIENGKVEICLYRSDAKITISSDGFLLGI